MSKSSSVSVCLLEPSSRSIARKRALLRMARVNSNNSFKNNTYDIKMLNMKFVLNLTNFCFITSCYNPSIA